MQQIVINAKHGGFDLSVDAQDWLKEVHHIDVDCWGNVDIITNGTREQTPISRDDKRLIECITALGKQADGAFSELKIIEIPDDVEWQIEEYDGLEWVAEKHRCWS